MLWQSTKAADLLRDPRIRIHSVVTSRDGGAGNSRSAARPAGREFIRRGDSATSVGDPEPVRDILTSQ
jgi:hypothetical protein